jgi:hypothetical protein
VASHFRDAALIQPHELAARDVQAPPLAGGCRTLHRHDEVLANRDIKQLSPECLT